MNQLESERPLVPGTVVARNYRVLTRLGAGGMGTVYLAENLTLQQRVVVKVLRGGQAGAGHEEAQVLANLQHPNVVTVFAHDPQLDCIVMEYLDGVSLNALFERGIDRVSAIRIALSVAEALAAVHKRGLVHRDIKPENVRLALNQGGGGRFVDWLKLIDFGTALKVGKVPEVLLGTPEYCPPEQFHAEPAHPANDVYALGVTIFLMMTGVFPFACAREELPRHHHEVTPPGLLEALLERFGRDRFDPRTIALLEDLSELVAQMLAKRVPERPSAQEVARWLTRLESSFAEAGTVVSGRVASPSLIEPLVVPKRPSGRAVLSGALVPSLAREVDNSSSATASDVAPVPTSPSDQDLASAPTLPPVSALSAPTLPPVDDDAPPRSQPELPSAPTRASPRAPRRPVAGTRAHPVPVEVSPPVRVSREGAGDAPPRSNKGLIAVLLLLVAVLAGALLLLEAAPGGERALEPELPPVAAVDAGGAKTAAEGLPEPLDAGLPGGLEGGAAAAPVPVKVTGRSREKKADRCEYSEAFERDARRAMQALRRSATSQQSQRLEEMSAELSAAFKARDCGRTQAVLKRMSAVVRAAPR